MNKKLRIAPYLSFYCFKQTFHCSEDSTDEFGGYFETCDFTEGAKNNNWLEFWHSQGNQIVLRFWNIRYKDFIANTAAENQTNEYLVHEESKTENKIEPLGNCSCEISPLNESNSDATDTLGWQNLWEEHYAEVYADQYKKFEDIYENYYWTLQEALEIPNTLKGNEIEYLREYKTELEHLKLAGLPTAFGSKRQSKHKNFIKKNPYKEEETFYELTDADFNLNEESEDDLYFSATDNSDIEFDDEMPPIKNNLASKKNEHNEDDLHTTRNKAISKQTNKKNRMLRSAPEFIQNEKEMHKYWRQRFSLFSRFDEGIQLDRESWFSVTPEKVAKHMAQRIVRDVADAENNDVTIVDGFCGCGGNAIQFAMTCAKVIAIDIDPTKIEMAKHNANIYGVSHNIEFHIGDFLQICEMGTIKADAVFLSPPWGGPEYKTVETYNIERCLEPVSASELMRITRKISNNIAFFLPRNADIKQIIRLAGEGQTCEVEHNFLDKRVVGLTALYGDCIEKPK